MDAIENVFSWLLLHYDTLAMLYSGVQCPFDAFRSRVYI